MCQTLLFWMIYPPDPNIDYVRWAGFCDAMAGWVVIWVVMITALVIGLYRLTAHVKKIRTPDDYFAPYTPMRWLWLAWLPPVVLFAAYTTEYQNLFRGAMVSSVGGAVRIGLEAGILTFCCSYLLMWIPGLTPVKYRYRPRWLFYRKKGRRR